MELKYEALLTIAIIAIVMFPISKATGASYSALVLASLMLITAGVVAIVVKTNGYGKEEI